MSTGRHTPEPWSLDPAGYVCADTDRVHIAIAVATRNDAPHEQNAARIVQCVNACAGIEDPAAAIAALVEALRDAAGSLARLPDTDGAYRATCLSRAEIVLKSLPDSAR